MNAFIQKLNDGLMSTGLVLIVISLAIYLTPTLLHLELDNFTGIFFLNYIIAAGYFFLLLVSKNRKVPAHNLSYTFLFLILALISAYSLNREMEVFAASPLWFTIVLVVVCCNYVAAFFFHQLPPWGKAVVMALLGLSLIVFVYLGIYLFPLYLFSIPAALALGVSLHTFVPLLFCIYTVILIKRLAQNDIFYWVTFSGGIAVALAVMIAFATLWHSKVVDLNGAYQTAMIEGDESLPAWVQVAQRVSNLGPEEKILKTGLVYHTPDVGGNFFWGIPERSFGEEQKLHDPLVVIASLFSKKLLLTEEERIKILESNFDARHQAEERLWSGKNLLTEMVATSVSIWPEMHLAYTEKVLTVTNATRRQWSGAEEAIYTFHLPEGAVVTSLSLWIAGKEEKGILTTKEKADSAYKTIVGVESRDPSVVHWQEGNTVRVRVFPVLRQMSRTFKIGITAPLQKEGDRLAYRNIWFEGPNATGAQEKIHVQFENSANSFIRTASFTPKGDKSFVSEQPYKAKWSFYLKEQGLLPRSYSFNGQHYFLKPYQPQRHLVDIANVYLDINSSWTKEEWNRVWALVQGKKVWVYDRGFIALNKENAAHYFNELQQFRFSLFPVHEIKDATHSLIISKSNEYSPNLSDLQNSTFGQSIKKRPVTAERINFFNLGYSLSPYLQSLKEQRFFQYESGDLPLLSNLLQTTQFVADKEDDAQIIIHSAGVVLVKKEGEESSTAPDHLMRLFAYNHILQQFGKQGSRKVGDSALIAEAQEAYVVSPVSSLVVLETQKDYDRFGIEDSRNSLKNATLKSKGAVPEPHEWVLIVMVAVTFLYISYKQKIRSATI